MATHDAGLALKADLHPPWLKLRKLCRWLASFGVVLDSESAMRETISEELPFELSTEPVPLTSRMGNIELRTVIRFPGIKGLMPHYLDQHKLAKTLSWHEGAFLTTEVWLKLGGDHGGGSLKLSFQLANVKNPSSVKNTIPFLVFRAPDSTGNLATTVKLYVE